MKRYDYYAILWIVLAIAALIVEIVTGKNMSTVFMGSLISSILYCIAGDFRDQLKMKGE